MKNKLILIVINCAFLLNVSGQDEKKKFLYIDAGVSFIGCEAPEKDYIRDDVNPYYYYCYYQSNFFDNTTNQINAMAYINYFSIKGEYKVLNNIIGLTSGIRYMHMESSIGKVSYWESSSEFFYLLYKEDGINSEYARVNEIVQNSHYLGIPVEFKIYPNPDRDWWVNVYYKIGADFNFHLHTKESISFFNDEMKAYQDEVSAVIEEPYFFAGSAYLAVGIKIGQNRFPGVNIEACVPSFVYTSKTAGLVKPIGGGGLQFNIRLPF
jgi:hypothetical protein